MGAVASKVCNDARPTTTMEGFLIMQVNITKLLAANIFASTEHVRYYLNGVLFEVSEGKARIVATDGQRMIIFDLEGDEFGEDQSFIIPSSLIKRIKAERKTDIAGMTIKDGIISIEYAGAVFSEKAIDGTYPDYRRIMIPDDKKQEFTPEIRFNPSYLGDFAKVNKILGRAKSSIVMTTYSAEEPVKVTNRYGDYTAILMPMRA